jgi:hypothetical protein
MPLHWLIGDYVKDVELSTKYSSLVYTLDFQGKIYSRSQVQTGTFAILRPWSDVANWGKDSLLTYEVVRQGIEKKLKLTAWSPNRELVGSFLKAEEYVDIGPLKSCELNCFLDKRNNSIEVFMAGYDDTFYTVVISVLVLLLFLIWSKLLIGPFSTALEAVCDPRRVKWYLYLFG